MNQPLVDLLKELSTTVGITGHEENVRTLLRTRFAPYVDDFEEDKVGNLVMLKRGLPVATDQTQPRRKVMLVTHADEIGAIVTKVDRGFLRIDRVGGLDLRFWMGQEVLVFGRETWQGVVACYPPHLPNIDRDHYPETNEYLIDLGLPAEVVAKNIQVGDLVVVKKEVVELFNGRLSGKSFDNRASVAALYVCLEELAKMRHEWDVYAVASCQEELTLLGALASANRLQPDVALVVDVTFANVPGVSTNNPTDLGKGPGITVGANLHPVLSQRLRDIAAKLEMPLQTEVIAGNTGTDAWVIQTSQYGIPTALLDVPMQYMHSPVETIAVKDVARTGRLMAHFITSLTEDFIDELIPQDGLEA